MENGKKRGNWIFCLYFIYEDNNTFNFDSFDETIRMKFSQIFACFDEFFHHSRITFSFKKNRYLKKIKVIFHIFIIHATSSLNFFKNYISRHAN